MARFDWVSELPAGAEELYQWHLRPGAFARLVPPWEPVRSLEPDDEVLREGSVRVLQIGFPPLTVHWHALHRDFVPGHSFVDEMLKGPFSAWRHQHCFEDGRLRDQIEYRPPLGLPVARLIRPKLERMFRFRHQRTRDDLELQARYPRKVRVAITGSTGLVGGALSALFTTGGHQVHPMVRSRPSNEREIQWLPELDAQAAEGLDTVVHLAGEPVLGLWTRAKKQRIRDSRVVQTEKLCAALARLKEPPRTLVVASAIGYFGSRGGEELVPESPPGEGFLAQVCRGWEAATEPARTAGIRVVTVRVGVVLTPAGGALMAMLPSFWSGFGGVLGGGGQYFGWISHDDIVRIFFEAALDENFPEVVHGAAPGAITQAEFADTLARVLRRPRFVKVPEALLRGVAGELAEEMFLVSQRVRPAALEDYGFRFLHPSLEPALRWLLGR